MKAVLAAFNQEKALVGAFSVIVKTDWATDGSLHSTNQYHHHQQEMRPRNQYRDKWRLWKLHGAANRLELSTILRVLQFYSAPRRNLLWAL